MLGLRLSVAVLCCFTLAFGQAAEPTAPRTALRGFDPVELAGGTETAGRPEIAAVRGGFRYLFASEENRRTFESGGERFAIQFGGACMKMGPLSGGGSPDRFSVHEGRIYVFASDSCLAAFEADPERFVDRVDAPATGTPEAAERGKALLERALGALGGPEVVRSLRNVRTHYSVTYTSGERVSKGERDVLLAFPGTLRHTETWGQSGWTWLLTPTAGYYAAAEPTPADPSVQAFMTREYYREPLALLKAWQDGQATAFAVPAPAGGTAEYVALSVSGATATLGIGPDGRLVELRYRGRGGSAGIGDVVRTFSDFRAVDGFMLPFGVATAVDGRELSNPAIRVESIRVNAELEPGLLRAGS